MPSIPNRTCSSWLMLSSRSHLTLLSYSHGPCIPAFCCVTWAPLPPATYTPELIVLCQAPYYLSARHQNATHLHLLLLFGGKKGRDTLVRHCNQEASIRVKIYWKKSWNKCAANL